MWGCLDNECVCVDEQCVSLEVASWKGQSAVELKNEHIAVIVVIGGAPHTLPCVFTPLGVNRVPRPVSA